MEVTYEWDCRTVDVFPTKNENTDVVYNVHWRVTGLSDVLDANEDPYSVTMIGTQSLATDNLENFTPIEEITNEEVTEWVKSSMEEGKEEGIVEGIRLQLEHKINPPSVTMRLA